MSLQADECKINDPTWEYIHLNILMYKLFSISFQVERGEDRVDKDIKSWMELWKLTLIDWSSQSSGES